MKWHAHAIGEVAQVNPKLAAGDQPDPHEKVSFVPMAAVSEETTSIAVHAERPFIEVSKGYTPFKRGDVLVAKITPCFENGKMAFAGDLPHELGFGTTEFHVFRPSAKITGRYLFNLLRVPCLRDAGALKMRGAAGQRRVPAGFFSSLRIPLPPLAEQRRISRILDAADALRAKRRETLVQLDTLLQSTFLEMFGDPVTNPMRWTEVRSGELFRIPPKIGTTTPATDRGYLVVRVGELGESRVAFERCGRVEISEKEFAKFRLERGDTVIARAIGSMNHLGKASFFAGFDEATVIDSHVMRLRPDPLKCDGLWFYSLISSDRGKVLLQQTGGATAVQFNINAKQASSMQVALPPLDLQHQFAAIVESVERQKTRQRSHLAELDTLFASLQSRAFLGDL